MEKDKLRQRYPVWLPNLLLIVSASLFGLTALLGFSTYRLATRSVQLQDLSTSERQNLIRQARRIVPAVFQPFPLNGEILFYHMVPDTQVNVPGTTFTTNDLGFRTIPSGPKPEGVRRIVVVGDSWTYGLGVQHHETFPYQLQNMLNRNGVAWQVYNLSMPGWNTANQIAALRTFFSRLKPDVVVFCPVSNDIDDSLDVWDGRQLFNGFFSGASFRHSYLYQTRWIQVFQSLQSEVDNLRRKGVPSLIFFLAEWRKLAPYYANLSGLSASYTVIPTEYLDPQYRLSPNVAGGGHATPEGLRLIATYLHNALLEQQIVSGLELLPANYRVVFPGRSFSRSDVDAELTFLELPDLIPLNDGFMGREGLFSVPASSAVRTVYVQLGLIDDPGLYPLTVELGLESAEKVSLVKVFDHFVPGVQVIEISKPSSLDVYPVVELRVTADHVVVPKDGLIPISMRRPEFKVR